MVQTFDFVRKYRGNEPSPRPIDDKRGSPASPCASEGSNGMRKSRVESDALNDLWRPVADWQID
ncbi:MAG: hypothetical protein N3C63_06740 [Rhodocyclaceae bacterium]|nr:hypothetical protein [Rhodocyclaceae bacterium]